MKNQKLNMCALPQKLARGRISNVHYARIAAKISWTLRITFPSLKTFPDRISKAP
jgi:hypothetical protein